MFDFLTSIDFITAALITTAGLLGLGLAVAYWQEWTMRRDEAAPVEQRYVLGFAFYYSSDANLSVVLIRKQKPVYQAGRLNGVGGKVKPGETAQDAMAREFEEETGVRTLPEDWTKFATFSFDGAEIVCFRTLLTAEEGAQAQTQTVWSDAAGGWVCEEIEPRPARGIDEIPGDKIMPNLRWLIPMALDVHVYHAEVECRD